MNTAEVVKREMQSDGSFQVRQFLAIGVREPRQSAKRHAHGEVLPFHVARRNVADARSANEHLGYNLRDSWWRVPPFIVLAVITKQLDQLREINIQSERLRNRLLVEIESVRSQLDLLRQARVQIANETDGAAHRPLPDEVGSNQLCVRVLGDENPLIAYFRAIIFVDAALLLSDKTPDFIALYIAAIQIAQHCVEHFGAALTSLYEHTHDRIAVESGETFRAANGATFEQAFDRRESGIGPACHRVAGEPFVRFAEGSFTGCAAPTLDAALTKVPKSFAGLVLTSFTGHLISPLALGGETSQNSFGSEAWVTPRFGLAPQPVSAGSGALIVRNYGSRWDNGNIYREATGANDDLKCDCHRALPFSRCAVLRALRGSYLTPTSLAIKCAIPYSFHCLCPFIVLGTVKVDRASISTSSFEESVIGADKSPERCVKHGQGLRVTAYVHAHEGQTPYYLFSTKSSLRFRLEDLSAEFGKARCRCNTLFISQRLKRLDRFFQLSNPLLDVVQFRFPLVKFLLCGEITGSIRIYINIRHRRSVQ